MCTLCTRTCTCTWKYSRDYKVNMQPFGETCFVFLEPDMRNDPTGDTPVKSRDMSPMISCHLSYPHLFSSTRNENTTTVTCKGNATIGDPCPSLYTRRVSASCPCAYYAALATAGTSLLSYCSIKGIYISFAQLSSLPTSSAGEWDYTSSRHGLVLGTKLQGSPATHGQHRHALVYMYSDTIPGTLACYDMIYNTPG